MLRMSFLRQDLGGTQLLLEGGDVAHGIALLCFDTPEIYVTHGFRGVYIIAGNPVGGD